MSGKAQKPAAPRTLKDYLDACAVTGMNAAPGAIPAMHAPLRDLAAALAADPVLRERAEMTLAAMDPAVLMRDHVSRWTKRTLEAALAGGIP